MWRYGGWGMGVFWFSLPAWAEVTLYGQLKGGVAYTKQHNQEGSVVQMEDYLSKFGLKSTEPLGDGTDVIWQVETGISLNGNREGSMKGWNSYDSFIGIQDEDLGTVRVGYLSDGMFGVQNQKLFIGRGESKGDAADPKGLKIFMRADKRWQGVRYDIPHLQGFDFNITHQLADSATTKEANAATVVNQATIVAGAYQQQAWYVRGAVGLYKHQSVDTGDVRDAKLYRILAGYDDKKTYVGVSYQYTDGFQGLWEKRFASVNKPLSPTVKTHEAVISASHKIGRFTLRASYAHGWDETLAGSGHTVSNTSYDQIIIGSDYAFSKSTIAMTSLGWIRKPEDYGNNAFGDKVGIKDSTFSLGLGLRKTF